MAFCWIRWRFGIFIFLSLLITCDPFKKVLKNLDVIILPNLLYCSIIFFSTYALIHPLLLLFDLPEYIAHDGFCHFIVFLPLFLSIPCWLICPTFRKPHTMFDVPIIDPPTCISSGWFSMFNADDAYVRKCPKRPHQKQCPAKVTHLSLQHMECILEVISSTK